MSQATQARNARERATIAARYIRSGQVYGRAFSDCFEMCDGDEVVGHLLARNCPKINAYAAKAGWWPSAERVSP